MGLGGLEEALADGANDVLLVHDQALAPEGVLAGLGQALAGPIEDFAAGGGTVVVLATDTMGNGVPSPLLAKEATASILTKEGPSPGIAHVFTNETASPVVIHKVTSL